ncbi:hypothetical protein PHLGIDRAFT_27828 [Phlebiopsis gigantea 11061_1 CR5-6]|uniref:Apurinic-apyrimidinic endonuclease 1 n=1 Tax=Phlebiopsis gigantea (strain 11061_1 CR5-6) TaxID=745531 RepID=A0A0C3PUY2_PHLG1|nr:hypothetical protein PHLGIDRAFT_27828 [Phlebiopsis gigantea 11061_1 CR5-6]
MSYFERPSIMTSKRAEPNSVLSLWKIGPHISAAGGVENAILNAASIGATAFALFLKSQRKWDSPSLTEKSIEAFKARLKTFEYDVKHILPHGNYLVNLGNPDPEKREKSYQCFLDELKRCEQLGLTFYNFHPGSSVGQTTQEESLSLVAQCLNRAHKETSSVVTVIESMVGSGNVLCSKFEEIGKIIEEVEDKSRVGVCLDTCHIFAAGYDIRTKEGWNATMKEFERDVGLKYLKGMHFNDSKGDLASRKDRHENIGLGHLGLQTFSNILNDTRTQDIPLILETPAYDTASGTQRKNQFKPGEGWDIWRTEVAVLNRLAGSSDAATSDEDRTAELEQWTEEIRKVVERVSSAAEKQKHGKVKTMRQTRRKKKYKEETDDEGDSCDD